MAHLRRSARASMSKRNYNNDFSPSYPDKDPITDFERRVAALDQQSFPWKQLTAVDDVLVYSLFSSKRRTRGCRAIKTQRVFGEEHPAVTAGDGISIRRVIEQYLPEGKPKNVEDFGNAARVLVNTFPQIFSQNQLEIIEQYVLQVY